MSKPAQTLLPKETSRKNMATRPLRIESRASIRNEWTKQEGGFDSVCNDHVITKVTRYAHHCAKQKKKRLFQVSAPCDTQTVVREPVLVGYHSPVSLPNLGHKPQVNLHPQQPHDFIVKKKIKKKQWLSRSAPLAEGILPVWEYTEGTRNAPQLLVEWAVRQKVSRQG